jgi:hybrid cluster-associated redox disulfide protein
MDHGSEVPRHDDGRDNARMASRVILDHGLLCVGCPVASFDTLSEAAREHSVDESSLVRDIQIAAGAIEPGGG